MYRFKDPADFTLLNGLIVQQICLGCFETQIGFNTAARISMEGTYVHQMPAEGREITQAKSSHGPNELFRLLGESVVAVTIISQESLKLTFSNGGCLLLIDDSDLYKSFVIGSGKGLLVI